MLPKLTPGRIVLAWSARRLKIGDVVILLHSGLEKIKRIDRIEGETVYVLGDNPTMSTDSRQFGFVPKKQILARIIWPRL